jgi:hypothetical protein
MTSVTVSPRWMARAVTRSRSSSSIWNPYLLAGLWPTAEVLLRNRGSAGSIVGDVKRPVLSCDSVNCRCPESDRSLGPEAVYVRPKDGLARL